MADDSNFVIRWEIDYARATLASRDSKVESDVFYEGGFKWVVALKDGKFYLLCGVDHGGPWMCNGKLSCSAYRSNGRLMQPALESHGANFSLNERIRLHAANPLWHYSDRNRLFINGVVTFEFHVRITSSDRGEPNAEPFKFDEPSAMSSVILKIEEKELHVSKEFLSISSPVFEAMFFGGFTEKGKEEVEIKDVVYEEFIDFLNVLYPRRQGRYWITDSSILHVLALGDRFQVEHALLLSEFHLRTVSMFNMTEKLILADRYRLVKLRDHCLQTLSSDTEIRNLRCTPEYANFSDETKAAIHDWMMQLH